MRWMGTCAALLMLLTACTGARMAKPTLPEDWPEGADVVIFQAGALGGLTTPADGAAATPTLTLLADGRLIFLDPAKQEGGFLQAAIAPERLPLLYERLQREMAGIEGSYVGIYGEDFGTTRLYLWQPDGIQTAEVYGFTLEPWEHEQEPALLSRLRQLWLGLVAEAGPSPQPYLPEAALVVAASLAPGEERGEVRDWPEGLPALPRPHGGWEPLLMEVIGPEAKGLIEAVPYDARPLFRQGSDLYRVRVVPRIPLTYPWRGP